MTAPASSKAEQHPLLYLFPRLTRFYGLSFRDLNRMPRYAIRAYADAIPVLAAEAQLDAIYAASAPYMTDDDRQRMMDSLLEDARDGEPQPGIDPLTQRLALEGIGIKVVHEKKGVDNA